MTAERNCWAVLTWRLEDLDGRTRRHVPAPRSERPDEVRQLAQPVDD